jgi:hypothetical protein
MVLQLGHLVGWSGLLLLNLEKKATILFVLAYPATETIFLVFFPTHTKKIILKKISGTLNCAKVPIVTFVRAPSSPLLFELKN